MTIKLKINPERWAEKDEWRTGIYVRAYLDGKVESADIAVLEKESLKEWLLAMGGNCVVNVVGILLWNSHILSDEEAVTIGQKWPGIRKDQG